MKTETNLSHLLKKRVHVKYTNLTTHLKENLMNSNIFMDILFLFEKDTYNGY